MYIYIYIYIYIRFLYIIVYYKVESPSFFSISFSTPNKAVLHTGNVWILKSADFPSFTEVMSGSSIAPGEQLIHTTCVITY